MTLTLEEIACRLDGLVSEAKLTAANGSVAADLAVDELAGAYAELVRLASLESEDAA